MNGENYEVTSEIYTEFDYASADSPILNKSNVISNFKFTNPPDSPVADEDGDLVVQRKLKITQKQNCSVVRIEHSKSTVLDLVGLQLWRGALLLADWLLYNKRSLPANSVVLELGSGVGLTSIVAAMFTPVICTDVNKGNLLNLIKSNIVLNRHLTRYPVDVMELDFMQPNLKSEVLERLPNIKTIIAADVVYDVDITEAFVETVKNLLSKPPKRSIYIALEKRYVFTIADCDTVAPCYEHFLECIKKLEHVTAIEVAIDFPQYFHYDRVKDLVLWKISSNF